MLHTKPFADISSKDVGIAGGKGTSLGKMTQAGILVPPGFVVLANTFECFLIESDLTQEIGSILMGVSKDDMDSVEQASGKIQSLILRADIPDEIKVVVTENFNELNVQYVAVRSSFETADTDQAFWFIDYNRLLGDSMPKLVKRNFDTTSELFGQCASVGKVSGKVIVVIDPTVDFIKRVILVCDMTSTNFLPLMKKARAVVTNRGGVTCHAAIVSRELGVPCVIGTKMATETLKDGSFVEVDADNGLARVLKRITAPEKN